MHAAGPSMIEIDPDNGAPFYRQIIDQVLIGISTGKLRPGMRLPTVRQLAIQLQVNPNTVARAYRELEIRGIVRTQRGTGTFVASNPQGAEDQALHRARLETYCNAIVAEAGRLGISLRELVQALEDRLSERR
jgi:GntR family transcriptional regulator